MSVNNDFAVYLNSLHNASASNQNAIAEMQIKSTFFQKIQVEREIVEVLLSRLKQGEKVVLTGHAGDGKTTILAQILAKLSGKQPHLVKSADVNFGFPLRYVKDFSELTRDEQEDELRKCLTSWGACLVIANTGPLLRALKAISKEEEMESRILDAMSQTDGAQIKVPGYGSLFLLNIARIDNTDFIRPFLENITAPEHWQACEDCPACSMCPIAFNARLVRENMDRASLLIQRMYLWLQEYDRRTTIRQITAHIAFSMTGGLSCRYVQRHQAPMLRFHYLFSNLFFGRVNVAPAPQADQITGITLVNEAGFDRRQTDQDYLLHNLVSYDVFFSATLAEYMEEHRREIRPTTPQAMQSLRRAFLFFGNSGKEDVTVTAQVFSRWFEQYLKMRTTGRIPDADLKRIICRALAILFVGEELPGSEERVYLTLRRNNEQISNVQLVVGYLDWDSFSMKPEKASDLEGYERYQLNLHVERGTKTLDFPLSLPLLNYFEEITRGIIVTDVDPMLSNEIDSLKAQLLAGFRQEEPEDSGRISLIYMSENRWKRCVLQLEQGTIRRMS